MFVFFRFWRNGKGGDGGNGTRFSGFHDCHLSHTYLMAAQGVGLDKCISLLIFCWGGSLEVKGFDFGFQGAFPYPDC